jgi:hypothetical protein
MIHVGVTKANRTRSKGCARAQTYIKDNIKLWNLNNSLLSSDTNALNAVWRQIKEAQLPFFGRRLWNHGSIS